MPRRNRHAQAVLLFRTHGGARSGAGRKRGPHPKVLHRARPAHEARHPVHVTLRARAGLPSFRQELVTKLLARILHAQRRRGYADAFQVVDFSIQPNHLHLVVEAEEDALRAGVSGLVIAFARGLNALLRRKGKVWGDRYHRRDLTTPREVHHVLGYVFNNYRKHLVVKGTGGVDPFSTATRFRGFARPVDALEDTEPWPEVRARTWLLAEGWKKWGPIDPDARPSTRG